MRWPVRAYFMRYHNSTPMWRTISLMQRSVNHQNLRISPDTQMSIHSAVAPIQINFATRESFNDSNGNIILEFVCDNFTAQEAFEKEADSSLDGFADIAGTIKGWLLLLSSERGSNCTLRYRDAKGYYRDIRSPDGVGCYMASSNIGSLSSYMHVDMLIFIVKERIIRANRIK